MGARHLLAHIGEMAFELPFLDDTSGVERDGIGTLRQCVARAKHGANRPSHLTAGSHCAPREPFEMSDHALFDRRDEAQQAKG